MKTTHLIVDPDDFCRACGGKGGHYEATERGTNAFFTCRICRGAKVRSVRVDVDKEPAQ